MVNLLTFLISYAVSEDQNKTFIYEMVKLKNGFIELALRLKNFKKIRVNLLAIGHEDRPFQGTEKTHLKWQNRKAYK